MDGEVRLDAGGLLLVVRGFKLNGISAVAVLRHESRCWAVSEACRLKRGEANIGFETLNKNFAGDAGATK